MTPSASPPTAIYQRGLYFDGVSYVALENFLLNTSLTIEAYLWYPGGVSHGSLFEAFVDISIWDFYVSSEDVKFHAFGGNVPYIPIGAIPTNQWISAALIIVPTKVEIYVDGILADQISNERILFLDTPDSVHRIGEGFIGMIYYVCLS